MLTGMSSQTGSSIGSPNGWAMVLTRSPNSTGTAAITIWPNKLRQRAEPSPIVEDRQRHDAQRAEHQPEDAQVVGRVPVRSELGIDQK